MPKLIMLSAPSASGKSTVARELMGADGNMVRINRDDLRKMSIIKWTPKREGWIIAAELSLADAAGKLKRNIIVDDTNLMPSDEDRWKNKAKEIGYAFEKRALSVPLLTCVERDDLRTGAQHIGRPAIERQFLRAGLVQWPEDRQVVIFDIDGTLADLQHRIAWITEGADCPQCFGTGFIEVVGTTSWECGACEKGKITKKDHRMFYGTANRDKPIEIVVKWIQECKKHFEVLIVSGRSPELCGEITLRWLFKHDIPYDHIYMRRAGNHGPDDIEKQIILDDLLKTMPKEKIAFVVDDRPSVIAMWRHNGLRVIPVRGRDDDKFYEVLNGLEVNHPQLENQSAHEG